MSDETNQVANDQEAQDKEKYITITHEFVDPFDDDREVAVPLRFRRPTKGAVEKCQKKMGSKPSEAFRNLCVRAIHPDDKQTLLDRAQTYPGLTTTFGNRLLKAAGFADLGE